MAPKKKGKVNKLAKMSDEERARYLQHRADMEEEARRRKAELISRFMNNKLQKEEAFSKTNTAKLNQQWRYILRKIKCKQQAQDIQGLISTFDFMVERKNNLLTTLMKAIEEADEQYRRMTQAHMETINQFLEIGTEHLVNIQDEYDSQRNALLEEWDKEYTELTGNHEKAEYNLRLLIFIKHEEMEIYKKQNSTMVATVRNDAKLSQEERIQELTRPKELELESYWNQLRGVYTAYLEQHSPIMNHYNTLREKDDFYKRDIARNADKITCMNEILLSLQKEWNHAGARMARRLSKMNQEKEETSKRYWELKKSTKTEKTKSEDYLTVVVNASQDAIEKLQKTKNKLEKILQLAAICGKYETDDDQQVMIPRDETNNDQTAAGEYENLNDDMIAECEELKKLDKFYLKVNRVKVQTISLRTERDKLSKENEQLKNYMKKHLTELALQSGKDRPSTTMYYKTDSQKAEALNLKSSWNNRPVTCIEGALSNAVLHEKRMKVEQRSKADRRVRSYPRLCWH